MGEQYLLETAHDRTDEFRALPGLIQKYYYKTENLGEYGGVYLWQDKQSMKAYRESDLAATIPATYKIVGKPEIQLLETLFPLRE